MTRTLLKAVVLVAVAALFAPLTGAAQNTQPPPGNREALEKMVEEGLQRRLGNGCEPIRSIFTLLADEDQVDMQSVYQGGPLNDSGWRLVRRRLQVAGLHAGSEDTDWYLFVGLHMVRGAFMVEVNLHVLGDVGRGELRWEDRVLVSTGALDWPGRNDILQVVSERVDRFVLEYRRVNRNTCR